MYFAAQPQMCHPVGQEKSRVCEDRVLPKLIPSPYSHFLKSQFQSPPLPLAQIIEAICRQDDVLSD